MLPHSKGASLLPWHLVLPYSVPSSLSKEEGILGLGQGESLAAGQDQRPREGWWGAEGWGRLPPLIFSAHESPEEAQASSPLKLANYRMLMVILPIMMITASIT